MAEAYSTNERLQVGNLSWSGNILLPSLSQTGEDSIQWAPSKLLHLYEHEVVHLPDAVTLPINIENEYACRSWSPAPLTKEDALELYGSSHILSSIKDFQR